MSKFTVLSPLRNGGKTLEVGESVNLTEKEAQPLIELGTIGKPSDPKAQAIMAEVKEKLARDAADRDARNQKRAADEQAELDRQQAEADAQKLADAQTAEAARVAGLGTGTGTGTAGDSTVVNHGPGGTAV